MLRRLVVITLLLTPAVARPHDLGARWTIEHDRVRVEAFFDNDATPRGARVTVEDGQRQVVAEGRTDDSGRWAFPVPPPGEYQLTIDAGDGHKTSVALSIAGAAGGPVAGGSARDEFTRTRWVGLGIGLALIVAVIVAAQLRQISRARRHDSPDLSRDAGRP